jgi:hypothetical protein
MRLSKLADIVTDLFGGMCFIAPLDVAENASLSSANKGKRKL